MKPLRVLALEPYYGGSHQAFLDTWIRHSRHHWTVESLKPRHWKWRMRGSAIWFAEELADAPAGRFDVIFTCDMTAVADLRALLPKSLRHLPLVCYFHENQLTYPLAPDDRQDFQFGLTNITSVFAADRVWFNSAAHRAAFLEAARQLLRLMPDYVPAGVVPKLEAASTVMYPAVEVPRVTEPRDRSARPAGPLRILWSHRWEYDKNPEAFFNTVLRLRECGEPFELVLVGERFRSIPAAFSDGFARLRDRIVHAGFLESLDAYWNMIASCDVVVSTAIQENFGLAVVEAILAGCRPLLPERLSYPELIPPALQSECLYKDEADLFVRLQSHCGSATDAERRRARIDDNELVRCVGERFAAPGQATRLDDALGDAVG
jgi:glycosyltransferase involved in cell wall biosynthesis